MLANEQVEGQSPGTGPMTLYPTLNSLQEVIDKAKAQLPVNCQNQLTSILFTYHNTLLNLLK